MNLLRSAFRERSATIPLNSRNILKDNITRYFWEKRQFHSQKNEGGLRHKLYGKIYSMIFDEAAYERDSREHALRSDAFHAFELIRKREFNSEQEIMNFLENHPGFILSDSRGITLEEVATYIQENRNEVESDSYLELMR